MTLDPSPYFRVGFGFDVHPLTAGRPLILGGVRIPFEKGLRGHSDADVLTHAIIDALLGAAAAGDIGQHFPDTDPNYRGISSLELLARVQQRLAAERWRVHNVDATVVAEAPRLAPYVEQMRANLSAHLCLSPERINVKATTSEGLGFTGRGEGIAAFAVALLAR